MQEKSQKLPQMAAPFAAVDSNYPSSKSSEPLDPSYLEPSVEESQKPLGFLATGDIENRKFQQGFFSQASQAPMTDSRKKQRNANMTKKRQQQSSKKMMVVDDSQG